MKPARDLFSDQSGEYARFRPIFPDELFGYLNSIPSGHQTAWDAGTGNGQVALRLSAYFDKIFATDISLEQLQHARRIPSVEYLHCRAESTPLADDSVDLVTVGQALHWFSIPEFLTEVRRVLRPGRSLACFGYTLIQGSEALNEIIGQLYYETLNGYWPAERDLLDKEYTTIPVPWTDSASFTQKVTWDVHELSGYLATWSAVKAYHQKNNADPLANYTAQLQHIMTGKSEFSFPVFVKIYRPELYI